ncbi:protein-glutamate methylesterase/protein-glutamine glutaminase [Methylotuvimicrobium sp.]|uniref:protein-glutamate methylesterase/protein-glutamine glutaminase n=1 Tax=Methylotuvimicrobium sp. TaxID=2822413 RepID=UPI003D65370D
MAVKVLIVDDSGFICKRIKEILEESKDSEGHAEFEVVGIANNGLQAIRLTAALAPDVITMDIEMPLMDGITAVKRIMAETPTPILMFSAMTQVGAQATLDALHAGAVDFLPKRLDEIDADRETAKRLLRRRVRMVALQTGKSKTRSGGGALVKNKTEQAGKTLEKPAKQGIQQTAKQFGALRIMVIAASTGGPVAIQQVLSQVPQSCPLPVIIVQHMPQNFTASFAERLDQLCRIKVREARDGDILEPGTALVAAGGMQLEFKGSGVRKSIVLRPKIAGEIYSPCADITLASVARYFHDAVLAVVLTGMGSDGKEGARKLKQAGSIVWAQNEESCTIYGMPKAVIDAGLADNVYSIDEIGRQLSRIT